MFKRATGLAIGLLAVLQAAQGWAAEDDTELAEVVVSATKTGDVSAQTIPSGISAVSGTALEQANIHSLGDLARLVPSLQMGQIAPGDLQPIIRGIQSPGAGTVGVYFDETVVTGVNFQNGGGRTPDVGAYDLSRVEVLKGPQGTLFGASSMSGTVRFISNKPDASGFDAQVSVRGNGLADGGAAGYGVNGMVNIPLIDHMLAVRLVGWDEHHGGFIDEYSGLNAATKTSDANEIRKSGFRAMARFTPNDKLTIDAFVMQQKLFNDGTLGFNDTPNSTQLPITIRAGAPFLVGLTIPGMAGVDNYHSMTVPSANYDSSAIKLFGVTGNYNMGFGSVVATVSKYNNDPYVFAYDTTGTTNSFGLINFPAFFTTGTLVAQDPFQVDQQQVRGVSSGELRFNSQFDFPLNFVVGGFVQREDSDTKLIVVTTDPVTGQAACSLWTACIADPTSAAAQTLLFATEETYIVNSYAAFGHVNYKFNDQWKLDVGGRYFSSREHAQNYTEQAFQGSIPFTTPPSSGGPVNTVAVSALNVRLNESKPTWDASLAYQLTPEQMYYVRAATGFRQGGPNDTTTAKQLGIIIPETFQPDTVYSYEIGAKTNWLDQRLTLNGAYFLMHWNQMQVPGQDPTGVITYINNAAKSEINGIELEMAARPSRDWLFTFGGTWINAYLTQDQTSTGGPAGLEGDRIPKVPHLSGSATAAYTVPADLFGKVKTTIRTNMSYTGTSSTFFNKSFQDDLPIGGYFLMNLGVNFDYNHWALDLFINNVTDRHPVIDIFGQGLDPIQKVTAEPLAYGAELTWRFK
jgi:outer membrane receptor protein involved in Fe transport